MTKTERFYFEKDLKVKTKEPKDMWTYADNHMPHHMFRFSRKKNDYCQCQVCGSNTFFTDLKAGNKVTCPECNTKCIITGISNKNPTHDIIKIAYAFKHEDTIFVDYAKLYRTFNLINDEIVRTNYFEVFASIAKDNDGNRAYKYSTLYSWPDWHIIRSYIWDEVYMHPSVNKYYKYHSYGKPIAIGKKIFEQNNPACEYLNKKGLTRLAYSQFAKNKGSSIAEVLNINPNMIPKIAKHNIDEEIYKTIKRFNINCSQEDFDRFYKLYSLDVTNFALKYMSLKQYINYFDKMYTKYGTSRYQVDVMYKDYITMCKDGDIDLTHKSKYMPSNLKEEHDRIANIRAEIEYAKRERLAETRAIEAKSKEEIEDEKNNEKIYNRYKSLLDEQTKCGNVYDDGEYCVIIPSTFTDFVREGYSLNHCVGSSKTYYNKYISGESFIAFIRKSNRSDRPLATLEWDMKQNVIKQLYGFADTSVSPYLKDFTINAMKIILKEFKYAARVA